MLRKPCLGLIFLLLVLATLSAQLKTGEVKGKRTTKAKEPSIIPVESAPQDPYNEGIRSFKINEYNKAIESFNAALKAGNTNPNIYIYLGLSYSAVGKLDEALQTFDTGRTIEGSDMKLLSYNAGNVAFLKEDYAGAVHYYDDSLSCDDEFASAYLNRSNALLKQGKLAEARAGYARFMALAPNDKQLEAINSLVSLIDARIEEARLEELRKEDALVEDIKARELSEQAAMEAQRQAMEAQLLGEKAAFSAALSDTKSLLDASIVKDLPPAIQGELVDGGALTVGSPIATAVPRGEVVDKASLDTVGPIPIEHPKLGEAVANDLTSIPSAKAIAASSEGQEAEAVSADLTTIEPQSLTGSPSMEESPIVMQKLIVDKDFPSNIDVVTTTNIRPINGEVVDTASLYTPTKASASSNIDVQGEKLDKVINDLPKPGKESLPIGELIDIRELSGDAH